MRKKYQRYTKEQLEPIVARCTSFAQVLRELGLQNTGGNQTNIKDKIRRFEIDTKHFKGQGWAKGETKATNHSVLANAIKQTLTDDIVFSYGYSSKHTVRNRFKKIQKERCSECGGGPKWKGKPLTLHLDHINGDRLDNRLQNLRWLCPNCHQQTDTWGRLNASMVELADTQE